VTTNDRDAEKGFKIRQLINTILNINSCKVLRYTVKPGLYVP
jgi:hypothetical protein